MTTISYVTALRIFCMWRWFYTIILAFWTILFFIYRSLDWSVEVGYYNLYLGTLPAAIFLLLKHTGVWWAGWFAYIYDILVALALVVALIVLPNYMGLGFVLPLAGFICEGIVLTAAIVCKRPTAG
jgi:hypothetical protein